MRERAAHGGGRARAFAAGHGVARSAGRKFQEPNSCRDAAQRHRAAGSHPERG
jgi:hypothetical protein